MKNKFSIAMTLAVVLAMLLTSLALADNLNNDVANSGIVTITAGDSTTITYQLVANKSPQGDPDGCDATTAKPVNVTITKPANVSGPSSFSFNGCGNDYKAEVTFSSNVPGTYNITHTISGGITGSQFKNNSDFTLTVNGVTPTNNPPTLGLPADITAEATSADGAVVTFDVTASDQEDGALTPTCSHASGETFPLGTTQVDCSVTDSDGAETTGMFNVIVQDTTPPDVIVPADITAEATGPSGAAVTFNVSASDIVDGALTPTCDFASGSTFGFGPTLVTCSATDSHNNTGSASFNITVQDTTPPAANPSIVGTLGLNGWYVSNVTVNWNWSDAVGIDSLNCTTSSSTSADGTFTLTATCKDLAGNQGSKNVNVRVDTTAPTISAALDMSPAGSGWFNATTGASTVSFTCFDATSGLDGACPASHLFGEGADQAYSQTIHDLAGNSASAGVEHVNVDLTAPSISAALDKSAAGTGWFNIATGAPTVNFTCSDSGSSGLASCPAPHLFGEGADQNYNGSAYDNAGNSASAGVSEVDVDLTAPALNISGAASGESSICGGVPSKPTFGPTDDTSGVASSSDNWTTPSTPSGVGTYNYSATATDNAGNTASDSRTYKVTYGSAAFSGFLQPINPDGSSRFKLGSTIPVKFQLKCGGVSIANAVAYMYVAKGDSVADPGMDEAISTAASTTGNLFRYDSTAQQYIFNLSTKLGYTNPSGTNVSFSTGTWTLKILLDDGKWYSVNVQLPK